MSHLTDAKSKMKDLDSIETAAEACGLRLVRGQRTHRWYGHYMADSEEGRRLARERGSETFGRCDHALALKDAAGHDYEIGLVRREDGAFDLVWDEWGPGRRLTQAIGAGASRLKREYAAARLQKRAKATLAREGFRMIRQELPGNRIKLRFVKR